MSPMAGPERAAGRLLLGLLLLAMQAPLYGATPGELADMTLCKDSLGLTDLSRYQTSVKLVSPYGGPSSRTAFLPVFASSPLNEANATVKVAVAFMHGLLGNANTYFCVGLAMVLRQRLVAAEEVLVITPWFGNESVSGRDWPGAGVDASATSVFWSNQSWPGGGRTGADDPVRAENFTTAFDSLDMLVHSLRHSGAFPNLAQIVLAGFSAGAQMVQRYSLVTPVLVGGWPPVRLMVADPDTYAYFDAARPARHCRQQESVTTSHTCHTFYVPQTAAAECPHWDTWKFGFGGGLEDNPYILPLRDNATALDVLKAEYPSKDVHFFIGNEDTCNCNRSDFLNAGFCNRTSERIVCTPFDHSFSGCCDTFPDAKSNVVSTSCEADYQGTSRLQRALNYHFYLASTLRNYVRRVSIFKGGHNMSAWYDSPVFQKLALDATAAGGSAIARPLAGTSGSSGSTGAGASGTSGRHGSGATEGDGVLPNGTDAESAPAWESLSAEVVV